MNERHKGVVESTSSALTTKARGRSDLGPVDWLVGLPGQLDHAHGALGNARQCLLARMHLYPLDGLVRCLSEEEPLQKALEASHFRNTVR